MTKIKEYRICINGDFDILLSFSKEDIEKIGIDTSYAFGRERDDIDMIWAALRREIMAKDTRALTIRC